MKQANPITASRCRSVSWQIEAEFIPEEKQRGNLNPVSYSFLVEVVMAVPDASSCAFETINVIGIGALNVPLTLCKLDQPQPVNPNNGETRRRSLELGRSGNDSEWSEATM